MRLAATLSPNTCLVSLVKGPMDKLDVDVVYENLRVGRGENLGIPACECEGQ